MNGLVARRLPSMLFAAAGFAYLVRALLDLGSPVYYDPSTMVDYTAVVFTTIAMMSLAAAIASLAVTRIINGAARVLAWLPATALAVGGLANLLEDAFGMSALGFAFGNGNVLTLIGLFALAVLVLKGCDERAIGVILLLQALVIFLPVTLATAGEGILCLIMSYAQRTTGTSPRQGASSAEAEDLSA